MNIHSIQIKLFLILSIIFGSVTTISAQSGQWSSYKANSYDSGKGTAESPYVITTAEQLAYFAAQVTDGKDINAYVELGDDIDLGDHYWVPIGERTKDQNNVNSIKAFAGVFDGKGFIISNMKRNFAVQEKNNGFFGQLKGKAIVRNLGFENAYIFCDTWASETRRIGIVAGSTLENPTIANICIRNSHIEATQEIRQPNYFLVGGILGGVFHKTTIKNCYVDVTIDLTKVTMSNDINKKVHVAQAVGGVDGGTSLNMTNVYSVGTVKFKTTIVGNENGTMVGWSPGKANMTDCYYTHFPTDMNGNTLTFDAAHQNGEQKTENFSEGFKNKANDIVNSSPSEMLIQWKNVEGRPMMKTQSIRLNVSHSGHNSTKVSLNVKFPDEATEANVGSYEWSTSVSDRQVEGEGKSVEIECLNKPITGFVKLTMRSGEENEVEVPFRISPLTYSVDLYADNYASGTGTKDDPYLIANDLQLAKLARDVNNNVATAGKYYKLSGDIDLSHAIWMPIGSWRYEKNYFKGNFNGDGYTIDHMRMCWEGNPTTNQWAAWGLFSVIEGESNNNFAAVSNFVLDHATVEKAANHQPANSGINIGTVVGELNNNSEVSNIIVKNTNLTDGNETYNCITTRIGGVIGSVQSNKLYRLFNLSSGANIQMFSNANRNSKEVHVGGVFGKYDNPTSTGNLRINATNIYAHGTVSTQTGVNTGAITGYFKGSSDTGTWYYEQEATNGTLCTKGTKMTLTDFSNTFIAANNDFIESKDFTDMSRWSYSTKNGFFFSHIMLSLERGDADVITATEKDAETNYHWYVTDQNQQYHQVMAKDANGNNTETPYEGKSLTLPRQDYVQYVYAVSATNSTATSKAIKVDPLTAIPKMTKVENEDGTISYTVTVTNNIWEDNSNLDITYEWNGKGQIVEGTNNSSYHAKKEDKVSCKVTVKEKNGKIILERTLYSQIVVFLCPSRVEVNGITYSQGSDENNDPNRGYSPDKPMLTWKGAYSKLEKDATWDDNVIVLMGTSSKDVTNNTTNGFNFSIPSDFDWSRTNINKDDTKNTYPLFRNTTITGKWDDVDYQGTIEVTDDDKGLPIYGDTRFQNITFNHATNKNYDILYCQYNNLEMGEGIIMTNYPISPNYGTIDGAKTASFQIFGGRLNDNRFKTFNTKENFLKMEEAMPHGKEGFKITIKSGHYSTICSGGRQLNNNQNGLMGTPDMPVKCTITMDIDRAWNDDENHKPLKVSNNVTAADYDAGIIMAGNHEGAMFGDVKINILSGRVARVVNGTLGSRTEIGNFPLNTYMGRASILIDPSQSAYAKANETEQQKNDRVVITELYGGSVGRGFTGGDIICPFYGYSEVTIKGGTFKILPENNRNVNIACGIYGGGGGGMSGIGEGENVTQDKQIPYWDGNTLMFGDYNTATSSGNNKDRIASYKCFNEGEGTTTTVNPFDTKTQITIDGGVFGTANNNDFKGIFAAGSGYMSPSLWNNGGAIPSPYGGNIYGKAGATVASLTINGGTFYCEEGIFAGGRGTTRFLSDNKYGAQNYSAYNALAQTYGNVELTINGGSFHNSIYGGGYGVADAKNKDNNQVETLENMARIYGKSTVNINGGTFYGNIYGGGDMAVIEYPNGDATNVTISDNADIRGSVFAGGNGRAKRLASNNTINNDTWNPDKVGKVIGNTHLAFFGSTEKSPYIYGDIYGGGNLAQVEGNTNVSIYAANFAGQIFGGGKGRIMDDKGQALDQDLFTSADISGNTSVTLAQDQGGQEEGEDGKKVDNFSINVIWDKIWDATNSNFIEWKDFDENANNSHFFENGKYLNPHNIYGGGNLACKVGTYTDAEGKATDQVQEGTGLATVEVLKGMTPFSLLKTKQWKGSYDDNKNPHFSVFGGGYGANTTVGSTNVTVNVEGDYGIYDAEVDDSGTQLARPHNSLPVFDNSKGIPNFTVLGALGGGYAGTVTGNTQVTIDGQTFLHRVYGGGFGNPEATTADDKTGEVGGNTQVFIQGAKIYGDVFGGGAGVSPSATSPASEDATSPYIYFTNVARVKGTTEVKISDDAKVYGKVYGGGDIANVGPETYTAHYDEKPSSETAIDQETGFPTKNYEYTAKNYRTLVNIMGGDIFGEVYGGGKGIKKTQNNHTYEDYNLLGRINGNTLVHIANTYAENFSTEAFDDRGNNIPHVWNRIYGGCAYGTVDGNTLVHTEGGMLGLNIFGGGYGDVVFEKDDTKENMGESTNMNTLEQVLGKKDTQNQATYANILGNTKVQIDGGTWLWNKKADTNGNITTWEVVKGNPEKICDNLDEFKKIILDIRSANNHNELKNEQAKAALRRIYNDESTHEFFELSAQGVNLIGKFKKNHNIFGGGNRACNVGTYNSAGKASAGTGECIVEINHSPLDNIIDENGQSLSLLDCTTLQGLCFYLASKSKTHPQFSLFGAGYGANTQVGSTQVYVRPGAIIMTNGDNYQVNGKKYRYLCQEEDKEKFTDFQSSLYEDFMNVSKEDLKLYYGSKTGELNAADAPNTFRRYHMSRMAWKLGIPGFTFLDIHGGGFSGYVKGNTYVETDNQLACNNIYGAGLGAEPYGNMEYDEKEDASSNTTIRTANYDFGSIDGNAKVFIKSGDVSMNVYGGGAGIESAHVSNHTINKNSQMGDLVDFPEMARVKGKTEVHLYGETIVNGLLSFDRTIVIGSVYGGGDVANVGTQKVETQDIFKKDDYTGENKKKFTSFVNVRGGTILSQVFAGGKGRTQAECSDYTQLGGIYGNAGFVMDSPAMTYPYRETSGDDYTTTIDPSSDEMMAHPTAENHLGIRPSFLNRIYGGCQSGTIYGNTFVCINGGNLFHDVFGGGWGNVNTSADVTGHTNLFVTGGQARLSSYWLPDYRTWEPATIIGSDTYSPQYDPQAQKFKINHNIYGGGNEACVVQGNTYLTMSKGLLNTKTPVLSGETPENFFATNEWKQVYNKVGSPHFCIFGGGYGENTTITGDTYLSIEMAERGKIHDSSFNLVKGKEHEHFIDDYSLMDIVGGGYSGKVLGETHIVGAGGGFCRRVFGGGFYNSVKATHIDIKAIDCHDIFGGGLMGDVKISTNIQIGQEATASTPSETDGSHTSGTIFDNSDIFIHGDIYGANDVSGYVNVNDDEGFFAANSNESNAGTHITINGGHIFGNVYGAGNGDYLYALDRQGNEKVTVNENYPLDPNDPNSEKIPLVYTVPMREGMASVWAANDAAKIVNINSWRPLTNKTEIHIKGTSEEHKAVIDGAIYGGGNSATVLKVKPAKNSSSVANDNTGDSDSEDSNPIGAVDINIGSHVKIGSVFMGCNGDALFTATEDNNFMNKFQRLNGSVFDASKELDLSDDIDWENDPSNKSISTLYLPTKAKDRPSVYPHLIDLYFQPVEMSIQGALWWKDEEKTKDCTIGSFFCGGNRGNMNIYPKEDGSAAVDFTFPAGLTITGKIVGGCNKANYEYIGKTKKVTHEGGYLLGLTKYSSTNTTPMLPDNVDGDGTDNVNTSDKNPYIKLNIKNQFKPTEKDGAYQGGCVYGGCYETGTVKGNITIHMQSDMLKGNETTKVEKSNDLLTTDPAYSTLNVYGAGFGMESYVYGNTHIIMGDSIPDVSANFVYGGGQQGNVIGVTNVEIKNGHILRSVTGGSYAGFVWGSTHVKVGYPKYYLCETTGRYYLERTDKNQEHRELENYDKSSTIKQMIYLTAGDLVSQGVFEDAVAIDDGNETHKITFDDQSDKKDTYLVPVPAETPKVDWDKVNIQIDEAVYGGGYSLAQGSSVLANNTTVLKYTPERNLDNAANTEGNSNAEGEFISTVGYGGNTTILVGDLQIDKDNKDNKDNKEHITISHQEMKEVSLPIGTDLFGYYYKYYENEADKEANKYTYRYISVQEKYLMGTEIPSGLAGHMKENKFYEYDSEGGIFGDGHLSYAQGFRCADVTGYGFAEHTIDAPKIINTFQRMDILRLEDNCFTLLGARDYTVNEINKTPYSIARVGEIKMVANDNHIALTEDGKLQTHSIASGSTSSYKYNVRARNYMGLANNIHYVGAVTSNVDFATAMWHDDKGALPTNESSEDGNNKYVGKSYKDVKQSYIDDYNKEGNDESNKFDTFQKRNNGTAKNMIGIASGYALKIQLCQETQDAAQNKMEEKIYYGPVYGVIEMNLIEVREDEGGGYVYAENNHKRAEENSDKEDFLETTGNFVFPYKAGQYIVDDCFPIGFKALQEANKTSKEMNIHYWYVTGFHYYYNAHITGYTFDSSQESIEFNSNNSDGLTTLTGLKAGQNVRVHSWKMRSGHPKDWESDLEKRNYQEGSAVKGGYELYVGGSESNTFINPGNLSEEEKDKKGFAALLPMNGAGSYDEKNHIQKTLPAKMDGEAKISFKLVDKVDNTNHQENDYYTKHLSKKSLATLVLKAPAYESYKSETDNKPLFGEVKEFYTKNETNGLYEQVSSNTTLNSSTTYYAKEADEYLEITQLYKKSEVENAEDNDEYQKINWSDVTISSGDDKNIYYVPREYTYTIYLTIEYVQGPTISGNITIENCALPGEMIRLKKNMVKIDADQSFSANGYYWHIGKLKKNEEGKEVFDEESSWTNNISSGNTLSENTYKMGDVITSDRSDLFAGAIYDKTNDYIDIPAYYFMNGYGVQLAVTMNGFQEQMFPISMTSENRLVVHNYHEMDPHKEDVNLHISEAIERVNKEKNLAEPRIYIADQRDLIAFGKFIQKPENDGGMYAQFILQNDLTLPAEYTGSNATFKGTFHGNGHVIQGLKDNQVLFNQVAGNIYNLGLASGKISNREAEEGKIACYHCCFEYDQANPVVYEMDGKKITDYTIDDFKYGKVAYNLNGYYLRALKGNSSTEDKEALKYVYDYFANGDYQYAHRSDATTGRITGITYLRTGKENDLPNYGQAATRHDKNHTIDQDRAQGYQAATETAPESRTSEYLPLFNKKNSGSEEKNDFLFWGQSLQSTPADYPSTIGYIQDNNLIYCHQTNYMANRVYRTDGYYGTAQADKFYYNAYDQGNSYMSTYVHIPTTTAIDFTAKDDNAKVFHDLTIKDDVTKNLLVYTPADSEDKFVDTEAYDIANKTLAYTEYTKESLIKGHHIVGETVDGKTTYSSSLLHLVERTPQDENSEGGRCTNNNFCVPKAFNVTERAWYVRKPMNYANDATGAWEGICLPFTVEKAEASINGEITHFYGDEETESSKADGQDKDPNTTTQHHEYWLRGLTNVSTEAEGKTTATFSRPGTSSGLFNVEGTEGINYFFENSFFVDAYGSMLYNKVDNPYYNEPHEYKGYHRLTANVPYVVRFPGQCYYEFDLSSNFYNNTLHKSAAPQTITFNATNGIEIPVSTDIETAVAGYSHKGTFMEVEGSVYGMNADGTAFENASSLSTIMPFRTYIAKATAQASRSASPSVIYISETRSIEKISPEMKSDETPSGDYLIVRPIGQRRVRIESTYPTQLNVYTLSGQLYRVLDIQPGTATYSGFAPALYIFGGSKVIVK